MWTELPFVFIGGAFGAVCRYAISIQMKRLISSRFPFATFLINLLGSFLLGLLLVSQTGSLIRLLLGTGFLGGFTTFSTFQVENMLLYRQGNYRTLFFYMMFSVGICILAAFLGLQLGNWLKQ